MSEYGDLSDNTEVFKPDNSEGFHIEETEPIPDSFPEDTNYNFEEISAEEKAEADEFMKNNPELFENTEVTSMPTNDDDDSVVHNPDSDTFTIGKFDPDKNETGKSYTETAEDTNSSYYENDNENEIQKENLNIRNDEMGEESGNDDAIKNAIDNGQDFQITAKSEEMGGRTGEELTIMQNKMGIDPEKIKDSEPDENGIRRVNNEGSYYEETPIDRLEDEEWN